MGRQAGFWDYDEHRARLTKGGDPLVTLAAAVDFGPFRYRMEKALKRSDGSKGEVRPRNAKIGPEAGRKPQNQQEIRQYDNACASAIKAPGCSRQNQPVLRDVRSSPLTGSGHGLCHRAPADSARPRGRRQDLCRPVEYDRRSALVIGAGGEIGPRD